MPVPPKPHSHADVDEILHQHADMLADTPEQVTGNHAEGEKAKTIIALRTPAMKCCRCDLCATRTQVVFGEGSPDAKLMIVGEAPGGDEDRSGHPFWGRAGQVFNSLLEEAGLRRDEVWITNTVKCRPTKGEGRRVSNRAPVSSEIRACAIWRTGELEILKPKLICCLGSVSAKAILARDVKMTIERGQWLPFSLPVRGMEASEVILTYHPSYIMRQQGEAYDRIREQAVADFTVIAAKLRSLG